MVDYFDEGFLLESSEEPVEEHSAQAHPRQRRSATASRASTSAPTPIVWADEEHSAEALGLGEGVRTVDSDLVRSLLLSPRLR